jgi:hypothetical protein
MRTSHACGQPNPPRATFPLIPEKSSKPLDIWYLPARPDVQLSQPYVIIDPRQFDEPIKELNLSLWCLARDMARADAGNARLFGLDTVQTNRLASMELREVEALADDVHPHWELLHPHHIEVLMGTSVASEDHDGDDCNPFRARLKELNLGLWHLARDMARTDPALARRQFGLNVNQSRRLAAMSLKRLQTLADDYQPTWRIQKSRKLLPLLIASVLSETPTDRRNLYRLCLLSERIPERLPEDA